MTNGVTWEPYLSGVTPPTPAMISASEAHIGVSFPPEILPYFLQHAGQTPYPETIAFAGRRTPVGPLVLFLDDPQDDNITYSLTRALEAMQDWGANSPGHIRLLPFADNTANGHFCFDLAANRTATPVVFADLDYDPDEAHAITPIADSFTAFLLMLR